MACGLTAISEINNSSGGSRMENEKKERRSFLKHLLAGSAVVAGAASAIKPARAETSPQVSGKDEILYQETESFKKYYKSLRS